MSNNFTELSESEVKSALATDRRQLLIDVRTPAEFRESHAENAINIPLDSLSLASLNQHFPDREEACDQLVLVCASGFRAREAARKLEQLAVPNVAVVDGGLDTLRRAGIALRGNPQTFSLERQTQIVLGALLLLILGKGLLIHPAFFTLVGLIAAGLIFAGLTARCSLNAVLARMPWNQAPNGTA